MDMDNIISSIHFYLSHRGWTRVDSVRHVWLPPELTDIRWPRVGDRVVSILSYVYDEDTGETAEGRCTVMLFSLRRMTNGRYTWDVASRLTLDPVDQEVASWMAALRAVEHGLPLALSLCDLYEIAEEVYQSEIGKGGNHD
jgi:hypothetical protein